MLNFQYKNSLCATRRCFSGYLLALAVCFSINSRAASIPAKATVPVPSLDMKHHFALGMVETGNNDREVGGAGEISRYQIHPTVWKVYSSSHEYQNPEVSLQVARMHWAYLAKYYKDKTGREPEDFDMYVLWNTKFGYYARKGFDRHHINPVVIDRAQRFVNLVNRPAEIVAKN
jgi:hypothetical protein